MNSRRYLISGTSRGLGQALAARLLKQGHRVAGCARGAATLEHERYMHLRVDVTSDADVRDMVEQLRSAWGHVDGLVNNVGVARMSPAMLMPPAIANGILDVNVGAVHRVTHAVFRLLRKSDMARVVNISSVASPLRLEGEAIYAASKAAIESYTRVLARELAPFGITVNAVGPGPIRTDLIQGVDEDKLDRLLQRQAIPRYTEFEDVANVIEFFFRAESSMVTGQVVYLGGVG